MRRLWILLLLLALAHPGGAGELTRESALGLGKALGNAGKESVRDAATATPTEQVPDYAGSDVPERDYYDEGLGIEARARESLPEHETGRWVDETAFSRPRFTLDREKDPLLQRGEAIAHDPEATLGQRLAGEYDGCEAREAPLAPATYSEERCTEWGVRAEVGCQRVLEVEVDRPAAQEAILHVGAYLRDRGTWRIDLRTGEVLSVAHNKGEGSCLVKDPETGNYVRAPCVEFWQELTVPFDPPAGEADRYRLAASSCALWDPGSRITKGSYDDTAACRILEPPSAANGWQVVVEVDDDGGSSWHRYGARFQFRLEGEPRVTDHWSSTCGTGDACSAVGAETCLEPEETRIIEGVEVHRACWRYQGDYLCGAGGTTEEEPYCAELRERGCTQTGSLCLTRDGEGRCTEYEQTFRCPAGAAESRTVLDCGGALFCIEGECFDTGYEPNQDFALAASYLGAIEAAAKDFDTEELVIFKGEDLRCKKTVLGFSNCCKESGWGQDLGLAQCSETERILAERRGAGQCHYVGNYCSNDTPFGCIARKYTYCCFKSKLGRIIHEQGRPQIDLGWGEAKRPECRGFTPEELVSLDFAAIDFSEFYADALEAAESVIRPSEAEMSRMMEERIRGMMP